MNTRAAAGNLSQAMKELGGAWDRAQSGWHDAKSEEFHEAYLAELPHAIARATAVIEELDSLLKKIKNDCE